MDGIVFRTTDGARWGAAGGTGTGGNLTPLQFDENMWAFLTRLQALEDNPPVAVSITGFTVIGSQFLVNMTDATTRGPYDLPIATFRDVGEWVNNLPLLPLDFFTVAHSGFYRTLIGHTTPASPALFDANAIDEDSGSPTFGEPLYQLVYGDDAAVYDFGFFYPGKPGIGVDDGSAIAGHVFVKTVTMPALLANSRARLKVAAGATLSFPIEHNGTEVGSVNFASGQTSGTFTFTDDVDVVVGDVVALIKPAGVDSAARELSVTFACIRVFA